MTRLDALSVPINNLNCHIPDKTHKTNCHISDSAMTPFDLICTYTIQNSLFLNVLFMFIREQKQLQSNKTH